jgi:transcriptional regulator with XRE-family HTH domain
MTRQSFSEDEFAESMTLQNVSANLETIKRMKGWSVMEMSKHIGISDRHLDSLLKMNSNVTVLVLEKIAEGLGIPVLRLMGTRIVIKGHQAGADFLKEIRGDKWSISSEDAPPPPVRVTRAETRKAAKSAGVAEAPEASAPAGLEGLLQRIVDVQDRLAKDNSRTNAKVDKLSSQLESLVSAVKGGPDEATASSGTGAKRGPKGPRKGKAEGDSGTASPRKSTRGGAARAVAGATRSTGDAQTGNDAADDLFDRSAPEPARRRGRPPNAEGANRSAREVALNSRGSASVKTSKATKGPGTPKRSYNRKK